jgi:hypothetical protein
MSSGSSPLPLLLLIAPAFVIVATLAPPRTARQAPTRPQGQGPFCEPALITALSGLSLAAGAIHAAVAPEHYQHSAVLGVAFAVLAAVQVGFAAWVLRRLTPGAWVAGLAVNVPVVLVWLVSRTAGLPFGPDAGHAEAIGLLDALGTGAEVLLAAGCIRLLRSKAHRLVPAYVTEV